MERGSVMWVGLNVMPITGLHTMFYSSKPDELRAFPRDVLRFPFTDVGGGWLIFEMPPADMAVHPVEAGDAPAPPANTHAISFVTGDVHATVAELKGRGVEFTAPVEDHGYGMVTYFK